MKNKVIVVGGGAAGMMAALFAAYNGAQVELLEKNEKLGKKVFITGKGRCNVTNASDMEVLFEQVMTNRKFLYSGFYEFTNAQVMELLERLGCPLKIERGNRVFPVSDHSSDVIKALERELRTVGVKIMLYTEVKRLLVADNACQGVELSDGRILTGDRVIVATGGLSYPSTGSTGDGYKFAKACGHEITPLLPGLVPMITKEYDATLLQGLSLKNVEVTYRNGKKVLYKEFGEMLFTHFGVSGPLVLSASSVIGNALKTQEISMSIDLKPALTKEKLDQRFLREFDANPNKQLKSVLSAMYPAKLIPVLAARAEISLDKKIHEIRREERERLVELTKALPFTITGLRDMKEAIITRGGIQVKEVNPSTMESKLVNHLYFAGEVLDLDALTGGYNLQIAWSTGYLAGTNAATGE